MPPLPEDDTSALERARERLYQPETPITPHESSLSQYVTPVPHTWKEKILPRTLTGGKRHVRLATIFLIGALIFFLLSLAVAAYIFTVGGNSVSVDKVSIEMQGPTTIAGGDTVPLEITVTNKNAVEIQNATIEVAFPDGTRSATDVLQPYPRYTENIGTLSSGARITRTIRAVVFGGSGQTLNLPVSVSYGASGSNAIFVKKASYPLVVSTTPLSISVDAQSETVSGQPFTLTLTVRSNAAVSLNNVVVAGAFPFGFSVTGSSPTLSNSAFLLGTLPPGGHKNISLTGILTGQQADQKVFHFTVGTASTAHDQTLAVTYMSLDAPVTVTAPFISTALALNGESSPNITIAPGSHENVTLSYTNTLSTSITNATISVTLSGAAVDYNSIQTTNGFYRSSDHTIVFSRDTDPSLAQLAPGASGVGTFSFSTVPVGTFVSSPTITLTTSVSGARVGQNNVPEQVTASASQSYKLVSAVAFSAASLHSTGAFAESGPIPPRVNQATTYAVAWNVRNQGSAIAGGTVTATLPSYVTYTNQTNGAGTFSYDPAGRTVTWNTGDLGAGSGVSGSFQVSITPSSSQRGASPLLTGTATFGGYDRFAGTQISASADAVSTETKSEPGYVPSNATVQ